MPARDTNPLPPGWAGFTELARILRGEDGCPWDRAQSVRALLPYLVEESHEALHAAETGDDAHLIEELGDVCFVLSLTLRAAEEEGLSQFESIAERSLAKIQRRHPHVFAGEPAGSADAVARRWEETKREERAAHGDASEDHSPGSLSPTAPGLPALWQAVKLQNKAAAVGFDWTEPAPIVQKIEEELREVSAELAAGGPHIRLREEVGDLLFAVVNLARRLEVDPESALREGNEKFRRRFNRMMVLAANRGERPETMGLARLDELWDEVKAEAKRAALEDSAPPPEG